MIFIKKRNSVTIKDVAKKAGVSPSTVSRVISNNPKISKATSEKVRSCMVEMEYYPNAIARSLANQKTGVIGVIMPSTAEDIFLNPFFPEAIRGISKAASKSDYDILLSTKTNKKEELKTIKNFIKGGKVDGILLMTSRLEDKAIEYLVKEKFHFSLIGSSDKYKSSINHVDNDNFMAAYELTMYLASKNKKNISMIAGDETLTVTRKRIEGYKRALEECGLTFNEDLIFTGTFEEKTGYKYASIISNLDPRPDALIATDDLVAYGAMQVFDENNVKIPEDIAVASFNNSILSKHSNIPITSVDINAFELGYRAMKLLIEDIEDEIGPSKIIIPYTIYKRKSTED